VQQNVHSMYHTIFMWKFEKTGLAGRCG